MKVNDILSTDEIHFEQSMSKINKALNTLQDLLEECSSQMVEVKDLDKLLMAPDTYLNDIAKNRITHDFQKSFSDTKLRSDLIENPQAVIDKVVLSIVAMSEARIDTSDLVIKGTTATISDEAKDKILRRSSVYLENENELTRYQALQRLADSINDLAQNREAYGIGEIDGTFHLLRYLDQDKSGSYKPNVGYVKHPV